MPILIFTSIFSMVLQNGLFRSVTQKRLKTNTSVFSFNIITYCVCILVFGIMLIAGTISVYTVVLGLLFGIVTALANFYLLLALSNGPMHLTLLLTTSSMIIPTMSGVFFGERFSFFKLMVVFVLIVFLYLSFEKSQTKTSKKWFLYSFLTFLSQGAIGVLQKIHQSSVHQGESTGFLLVAFICGVVFCLIRSKGKFDGSVAKGKTLLVALVCGACTFAMNFINLKLSGMLPSQLFFPLINGSSIVLSAIMSIVLFKEHLSKRQAIGLTGGILSLIAICLVP